MDKNQIEQEFSFLNITKEDNKLFLETIKLRIETLTKDILYYCKRKEEVHQENTEEDLSFYSKKISQNSKELIVYEKIADSLFYSSYGKYEKVSSWHLKDMETDSQTLHTLLNNKNK